MHPRHTVLVLSPHDMLPDAVPAHTPLLHATLWLPCAVPELQVALQLLPLAVGFAQLQVVPVGAVKDGLPVQSAQGVDCSGGSSASGRCGSDGRGKNAYASGLIGVVVWCHHCKVHVCQDSLYTAHCLTWRTLDRDESLQEQDTVLVQQARYCRMYVNIHTYYLPCKQCCCYIYCYVCIAPKVCGKEEKMVMLSRLTWQCLGNDACCLQLHSCSLAVLLHHTNCAHLGLVVLG